MNNSATTKSRKQLRAELLRIFTSRDISHLSNAETEQVQYAVGSIINPPALTRNMPNDAEYQRAINILERTPSKVSDTILPDTGFSAAEISLVLQAIHDIDFGDHRNLLRARMIEILRAMAKGGTRQWLSISKSTDVEDMTIYSFLKDALLRAKSPDASRMKQMPTKRSQKRFWDGGVSV